jgi:hypothetical protein
LATLGPSANPATTPGDDTGAEAGTASSPNPAASLETSQRERAEAFYACLIDKSLPAQITDYEGDQASVGFKDVLAWGVSADGKVFLAAAPAQSFSGSGPPETTAELDRLTRDAQESPWGNVWYVDGVDRTEDYGTCIDTTGYTEPELPPVDQAADLLIKQALADASNEWAACARENGFPDIRDAVAERDRDTRPVVLLPPTVTAEQITQLVAVCPPFDVEAAQAEYDSYTTGDGGTVQHQPVVGFDVPGFREQDDEEPLEDPEEEARFQELSKLLWAERSAFFESLPLEG